MNFSRRICKKTNRQLPLIMIAVGLLGRAYSLIERDLPMFWHARAKSISYHDSSYMKLNFLVVHEIRKIRLRKLITSHVEKQLGQESGLETDDKSKQACCWEFL